MARRKFDKQFKNSAVKLILEEGYSVKEVSQELEVHANSLYRWVQEVEEYGESAFPGNGTALADAQHKIKLLDKEMLKIRQEHVNAGYRPMSELLKQRGYHVNHKKVQRLMKKLGLRVTSYWHKSRKYYSYKGKVGTVAKNKLHRRFRTSIPHQKITTDTTEFKYYEDGIQKKCYLNPYIDLFNSEVISYHISKQPSYQSIDIALNQALAVTSDCPYRRTFHSDQGWGYQMRDYVSKLKSHRIFQSMRRKGNCHDNSVMENFFGLLKQEIYYGHIFSSFEELEQVIVIWIRYYNTKRIKQKLNWMSPIQFRLNYQNN